MKNIIIYASRPRKLFGSKEDLNFLNCLNNSFKSKAKVLTEGHDFKYVPCIDMYSEIEKIVCKMDKVILLHVDGVIDQNQYYEVIIAIMHNIPVLAKNINSRVIKKVVGFEKYFDSATYKGAMLKLVDISPN